MQLDSSVTSMIDTVSQYVRQLCDKYDRQQCHEYDHSWGDIQLDGDICSCQEGRLSGGGLNGGLGSTARALCSYAVAFSASRQQFVITPQHDEGAARTKGDQ